jgi:hypothetical protein
MSYSAIPVLNDIQLQSELDTNGYVCLNFLNSYEVEKLTGLFNRLHSNRTDIPYNVLYTCHHSTDMEYRREMCREIEKIISPKLTTVFKNIQHTNFTFQIKGKGPESELFVHQDWSFSKESEGYRTYTFWLPLVDSTTENGTVSVLPGSHRIFDCIRGARITTAIFGHEKELFPYLTPLSVKSGQLLLFDSALVHYSSANLSDHIRVSIMSNIIAANSKLYLYFPSHSKQNTIEEYEVPNNFFLQYRDYKKEYELPPAFGVKTRELIVNLMPFEYLWIPKHYKSDQIGAIERWFKQLTDGIL